MGKRGGAVRGGIEAEKRRVLRFYLYTNKENVGQEDSVYGSVPGNQC